MIAFLVAMAIAVSEPSPVADAAMTGDLRAVRALLARGANVNVPQGDGMTALHWAAERGDSAMTATLLRARANVRVVTRIGSYTPLHLAAKGGSAAVVQALLAAGSDAKAVTTTGATALHFAAAAGNGASIAALASRGADVNAREREFGQPPLVFAATTDRADAVRALLKAGADPNLRTRVINLTEAAATEQAAARRRNEVLVSFEPEKHVDTSTQVAQRRPPAQPKGPFSPAQVQAAIDSSRAVYALAAASKGPVQEEVDTINGGVPGFAASVGGVGGLTALHHAVRQGAHAAVAALLAGGADIDARSHVDSTTPLLLAAINGHFDIALDLVRRGANPNVASTAGATPLYAVINTQWRPRSRFPQPNAAELQKTTHHELMAALLEKGADPNVRVRTHLWYFAYNNCGSGNCGLENLEGTTAFWRAAYSLDVEAMRLLMKHGADPNLPSQRTPQRAARAAEGQVAQGAAPAQPVAQQAARNDAGVAAGRGGLAAATPEIDSAGRAVPPGVGVYAIHAAAGVGYGNGFAGNSHRHVPDGWMPAMKYLVEELKADVNQRDNNGMTPLHHAASRGDNEMILYLVSKGADVRAVSRNFRTTVDMANGPVQRLRPFPETIALLEKLGAKNSHRCVSC